MKVWLTNLNVFITGVALIGVLAACNGPSSNFADDRVPQSLEIEILANNSKMFLYRVGVPEDQLPNRVHIARGDGNSDDGRERERAFISVGHNSPERLKERADYVIKKMNYCRDGFLVIDSSVSPMHAWLKGECKEDASADDRNKFGSKKILPVKL